MATEEKLVPGPPFFFSELPHLYTLSSSILSYNFDFLVIPVTLGIITLYMWSTFGKVDLGKRLIQALILGLTSFRQGIPGCQLPETWFRRWEPYSITVSLSLGLPTHSSQDIMKGRHHLKYCIQTQDPSGLYWLQLSFFFCLLMGSVSVNADPHS